ncbi:hypothetical protein RND71_019585 [Anisodus tanguticus]|uniref:Uncharacterized protein n=1 Tax=Anisodus tanguticus TaxID=243964 RepID=A0AAE1S0T6_9SOLA|nr:hypothetical protein RND71_019585 [Anisodus tanguticus]
MRELGQRQDLVNAMFWLMTFSESACFIGSQVLRNWFIGGNGKRSLLSPSGAVLVMAVIALIHEIQVLVMLFSSLHGTGSAFALQIENHSGSYAQVSFLPTICRYVPNGLRGGMVSLSLAPSNTLLLFFLVQRGCYRNIENSTIIATAALGLFTAAGCMYMLKQLGKQPHQNWHKL